MPTVGELLKELHDLPKGNVYEKTISGRKHLYHQYFEHGKRVTKLVQKEEAAELGKLIARRKILEKELSRREGKTIVLSRNASELTDYVMNGNAIVAKFEKGVLVDLDSKLAPLSIVRTRSLETFLGLRVLDMSRTNARILRKILGIHVDEDYKTALYTYALSVYDRYWFKPKHSKLSYENVVLRDDLLFETSLKGEINEVYGEAKLSPELTTGGSFEKGWRNIEGAWWLYKSGNAAQIFSELFCSGFASLIGLPTVPYEYEGGYIRCPNFSPKTNFEPIAALADDNEGYDFLFSLLLDINESLDKEYLRLVFFDSVINNVERHNENLGLLRDQETGNIISLAPNFDNNLALVATNEYLNSNPKKDGFIRQFVGFLKNNDKAFALFKSLEFKEITLYEIEEITMGIPIDVPHKETIAGIVLNRYRYLKEYH